LYEQSTTQKNNRNKAAAYSALPRKEKKTAKSQKVHVPWFSNWVSIMTG